MKILQAILEPQPVGGVGGQVETQPGVHLQVPGLDWRLWSGGRGQGQGPRVHQEAPEQTQPQTGDETQPSEAFQGQKWNVYVVVILCDIILAWQFFFSFKINFFYR